MITSDRRARMLLSCAVEGGDPAIAELVQNLALKVPGPRSLRACWWSLLPSAQHRSESMCLSGWPQPRRHASSFPARTARFQGCCLSFQEIE